MRQRIDRPRQSSHRRGPAQLTVSLPVVVLLLFCSLCGIPGGQTRLLPVDFWCRGYGDQTRELCPRGGSRSLLQTTVSRPSPPPTSAPNVSPSSLQRSPAPTPARTPAPAPAPSSVHHQAPSPTPGTSPQASPSKKKSTGTPVIVAAVTIGAVSLLLVVGAIFIAFRTRTILRKRSRERGFPWKQGISDSENEELSRQTFRGVPPISWGEIEAACEEFTNVIGDSADCIIFKGTRPSDGTQIAVTRMRIPPGSWTPSKEIGFRHKVNDLARMQHDNLLNLLAYCSSEQPFDRMLVFEYAPNGTVHEQLHGDDSTAEHLDWAMRMKIVMGAAYGLHYMHHELSPPRSHFRFDASHVFITDDYTAKVADFGITSSPTAARKSLGRRSSFNRFVRTITHTDFDNYRESSYRETPYFVESNIRGFGTFLLEVITGRRPYTETQGPLIDWASDYLQDPAKYDRLIDPSLKSYKESELAGLCEIVQLCVQQKPGKLPEMKEVVDMMAKALNMTQDKANRKASPLLWAEAQLLTSMDRSEDGGTPTSNASAGPSPRQWGPHSPGMPNNLWGDAGSGGPSPSPASGGGRHQLSGDHEISFPSTPNLSSSAAISREPNRGSSRLWSSNQGELQPPSPGFILGGEEQEVPLTGGTSSHRNSIDRFQPPPHDRDPRRSFRRAWAETATELSRLDGLSETSRSRPNRPFDTLSR